MGRQRSDDRSRPRSRGKEAAFTNEILTVPCGHHRWASPRPIDAGAALDDELQAASAPGTFGGGRDTPVHVVANEANCLALFEGGPSLARAPSPLPVSTTCGGAPGAASG